MIEVIDVDEAGCIKCHKPLLACLLINGKKEITPIEANDFVCICFDCIKKQNKNYGIA